MPFKAYEEFSAGPMVFPIGGKTYEVPEVPFAAGLTIQRIQAGDTPEGFKSEDMYRLLLGDVYDEMLADNVPAPAMNRAVLACLADHREGREIAEQVWEAGLDPEAVAPEGATEDTSTSTAEENETPTPASTSGTTSRRGSSKAKAKAAPKRASGTSSTSATTGL